MSKEFDKGNRLQIIKNGSHVKDIISGNKFYPDPQVEQTTFPFTEYFFSDGRWKSVRAERALETIYGTWKIVKSDICVKPDLDKERCRKLIIDIKTKKYIITDILDGYFGDVQIYVLITSI